MSATLTVDLGAPASERWTLPPRLAEQAQALTQAYTAELGGVDAFGELLTAYASEHVRADHLEEVESIAAQTDQPVEEVLLGNLYYDAVKLVLGCTAFAVDTPDGPLHARNLDWWTENDALSNFTLVTDFVKGGELSFRTVGWPGFVGALSGVAPGRFAVTLNAVLSGEPSAAEASISFLIRSVLEEARTFTEAVERLELVMNWTAQNRAESAVGCSPLFHRVIPDSDPGSMRRLGKVERAYG
ncbi:MAG: carcinine hydrolase/isopenicillin-N N-acyltransferase family protein, partial [Bacteroidota bacterium]